MGPLQLPVFGLVATAGIVAAMLLSQRTARFAGIVPDRLWDAGIVAVVSAFAASRVLLVLANVRLFLRQPLLVLAQPSLTLGGLAVTALVVGFWLRRHELPWRNVLDAWATPAALLAAVLQIGHFREGTDAGMPTTLPWGVHTPGDLTSATVQPVQLYATAAYLVLTVWLYRRLRKPRPAGETAALGLVLAGAASFFLSFLRQPYASTGDAWMDPAQYAALGAVATGLLLRVPVQPQDPAALCTPPSFAAEESR